MFHFAASAVVVVSKNILTFHCSVQNTKAEL